MLPTTVRIKRLPHYAHWTAQQNSIRDIVYGVLLLFDCQSHSSPGAINSYLRLISFPPKARENWMFASMRGCTQNRQLIPTPGPANTREAVISFTVVTSESTLWSWPPRPPTRLTPPAAIQHSIGNVAIRDQLLSGAYLQAGRYTMWSSP